MSANGASPTDLDEAVKASCHNGIFLYEFQGYAFNSSEFADPDIAGVGVSVNLRLLESSLLISSKGHGLIPGDSLLGMYLDGRCLLLWLAVGRSTWASGCFLVQALFNGYC